MPKKEPLNQPANAVVLDQWGGTVATGIAASREYIEVRQPEVRIFQAAGEGVAAQSLYIGGYDHIKSLRDLCQQTLDDHDAAAAAAKEG